MSEKRPTIQRAHIEPRHISTERHKPRAPREVETPGVDPAGLARESLSPMSRLKLNFAEGKVARFLLGKNKAGEIFHAIIDVLPIPNVHEVIKAVVKDHQKAGNVLDGITLLRQTFGKLDLTRTVVAVLLAIVLVRSSQWVGVDVGVITEIVQSILSIF